MNDNRRHHLEKRGFAAMIASLLGEEQSERIQAVDPLHLAVSAILLEAASADEEVSDIERKHIRTVLQNHCGITADEMDRLLDIADREIKKNPDLWRFTHQINRRCSKKQKLELMEEVWRIILADGVLGRHEDQIAHKLGRLLNLDHPELIKAKLQARK